MDWFIENWQQTLLGIFGGIGAMAIGWFYFEKRKKNQKVGGDISAKGKVTFKDVKLTGGYGTQEQEVGGKVKAGGDVSFEKVELGNKE